MTMQLARRAAPLVAALVAVVGIPAGSSGAATLASRDPALPPGYHEFRVAKAGFSIAVPDSWAGLDYTSPHVRDQYARLKAGLAPIVAAILDPARVRHSTVLLAADHLGVPNLEVELAPGVFNPPNERRARASFTAQFVDVSVRHTRIGGRASVEVLGTRTVTLPQGGTLTLHAASFGVVDKKGGLAVNFVAPDDIASDATVQTMIRSLRLLR